MTERFGCDGTGRPGRLISFEQMVPDVPAKPVSVVNKRQGRARLASAPYPAKIFIVPPGGMTASLEVGSGFNDFASTDGHHRVDGSLVHRFVDEPNATIAKQDVATTIVATAGSPGVRTA